MSELVLHGCTPEPLMNYLKALGVLRLVSEQADSEARGCWRNDVFVLNSKLDRDALIIFLLNDYKPTPILVPWSGNDFFAVNWNAGSLLFDKTPTGSRVIEAILTTSTGRFAPYRDALQACRSALNETEIDSKEQMAKKKKWEFIAHLRSTASDPLLDWIDCAAVVFGERFAPLLGSGGGSDGNTHFSDNFMQNLWDVLPDFDSQRKSRHAGSEASVAGRSRDQLENSLFGNQTQHLIPKRTSSLYNSGAVGGPNATQGMERESLSNPWEVVLALEGCVSFAAATVKRLAVTGSSEAGFPFQMQMSLTQEGLADKEQAGSEIWLPLWSRRAKSNEVLTLLREGRAQYGVRRAKSGLDMARAVSTLGIDRGISAFQRYAVLKGRVGGENYNTAASLGQFPVVERGDADLLRELDPWLDGLRRACAGKNAPSRLKTALRNIDEAIFEFCVFGGPTFFQAIVIAIGRAERELALSAGEVGERTVPPVAGWTTGWIGAANDNSPEFEIALALASIHDAERRIGPLRSNLEPVMVWDGENGGLVSKWAEKDRAVVWNSANLLANLAAVLRRRLMDGERNSCANLPLAANNFASIDAISRFFAGELDERRIEDLLWGLMLFPQFSSMLQRTPKTDDAPPLPRPYALLKQLFLPQPLMVNGVAVRIKPEPSIVSLLIAGRVGEACEIAVRRLRASGLSPLPHPRSGGVVRDTDWKELDCLGADGVRLAAALLLPISPTSINRLRGLVTRESATEIQTP
ncbi:MAG TPA: type I-U CRISPR-associated protein Csx17 [Terriglobales bacterium]|nr:type I-U CRISPR-associated protein Csx17 [Terriglobales bacterium]